MANVIRFGGGAGIDATKAFAPFPEVDQNKTTGLKQFVGLPKSITYTFAYTDTKDTISMTLPCAAGDTILAVIAARGYTIQPEVADGWEVVAWAAPHTASDNVAQQSLLVVKHLADSDTATFSFSQADASSRLYGLLLNIHDIEVGQHVTEYFTIPANNQNITEYYTVSQAYENSLILHSINSVALSEYTTRFVNAYFDLTMTPRFGDGSAAGGRLGGAYAPCASQQLGAQIQTSIGERLLMNGVPTFPIVMQLELIPATLVRYAAGEPAK